MSRVKNWHTQKIQNIVKTSIEQMPKEATNIRLVDDYRQSVGLFGTYSCWTEVEAVYKDDDGHEVGRVKTIDKIGGWQYCDPANYILYTMGLYRPYSEDNLKQIKAVYEGDLNSGACYPINNIYSSEYLVDLECKEAIFTTTDVDLSFILDYDYFENRTDMPFARDDRKKRASFKIKIAYNGKTYCTEHKGEWDAYRIFNKVYKTLTENGVNVNVNYDMSAEDKRVFLGHYVWNNVPF